MHLIGSLAHVDEWTPCKPEIFVGSTMTRFVTEASWLSELHVSPEPQKCSREALTSKGSRDLPG